MIHPLQWPCSGQTGEPSTAMLLRDGNAGPSDTPKGDSNDNDSSYLGAANRRVAEHGTAARHEPHRVGCAGRHTLLGLGAVRGLTRSPDCPLTKRVGGAGTGKEGRRTTHWPDVDLTSSPTPGTT
jgi:hypothetical protein